MSAPTECPKCHADLHKIVVVTGSSGDTWEGSRVIGIYSPELDRTTHWRCPDCGAEWQRPAVTGSQGPLGADAGPELSDDGAKG